MIIEQEFYEAFGIEPKPMYWCKKYDETMIADCRYPNRDKECLTCEQHYIKEQIYPPITSKTVLNLIKIILDCDIDILIAKDENGYIARKNIMSYSMHWVVDGNFNNTVLKLCIQLKDEIQDQVKALFNA